MLQALSKASVNFIYHQLRKEAQTTQEQPGGAYHTCTIVLQTADESLHEVFMQYSDAFLAQVSSVMLFEDTPDEATVIDLASECTNLIAGSAKIVASDNNLGTFDIKLPKYLGKISTPVNGTFYAMNIDNAFAMQLILKG